MSDNAKNYEQTAPALTTVSSTILAFNRDRKAAIIFNTSAVEIKIGVGTALIPIAVGNHLAFVDDSVPMSAIEALTSTGTGSIVVWEA